MRNVSSLTALLRPALLRPALLRPALLPPTLLRPALLPPTLLRPALCGLVGLLLAACGTNASKMEECRQIELARCRSAAQCGLIEDQAACERYIADECRHGFPAHLGPSSSNVTACVKAIDDIATCAKRSGNKTAPSECDRASLTSADADNVCELVEHPERISRCSFLAEAPSEDGDDEDDQAADAASGPLTSEPEEPATSRDAAADAAQ